MKTVVIVIGNSDDKLTQTEWSAFVVMMRTVILQHCYRVEFCGGPPNWERWQNMSWILLCEEAKLEPLKAAVSDAREVFRQDSVAWLDGETQLI